MYRPGRWFMEEKREIGRRHFKAEEKLAAVKRVLLEREAVSKVCEELQVQPSQVYQWQAQLFARGVGAFEREDRRERSEQAARIAALEAKLQRKDSVLAELMEEHVFLKKSLGGC